MTSDINGNFLVLTPIDVNAPLGSRRNPSRYLSVIGDIDSLILK